MGDPSYLRLVPASVANVPIDWTRVPEASRQEILKWAYDWGKKENRPLPATIADLTKFFDESKFFGYFRPEVCTLIMDISEFGLKATPGEGMQVGPRFYMKYLEQVWFLLFEPGTRDCVSGYSHDIIQKYDDDVDYDEEEKRTAAEETNLAQTFDVRLQQDVERGLAHLVEFTHNLGGWKASTLKDDLQMAQYAKAMLTLPLSHPAQGAFLASMFPGH